MSDTFTIHDVCESELNEVQMRRKEAFVGSNEEKAAIKNSLVGLAISGGGIRSAMFNLGVLQVLQDRGVMKFVVYMSAVSGGGYISAYYSVLGSSGRLSSDAAENADPTPLVAPDPKGNGQVPAHGAEHHNLESHPLRTHSRSIVLHTTDSQFSIDGRYLFQPLRFVSSYLPSTVCLILTYVTGLFMACSVIALFFRCFDYPQVRAILAVLNIDNDLWAALVGGLTFGALLTSVWAALRRWRGYSTRARHFVLLVFPFAAACSFAIMLGNADFYIWNSSPQESFSLTNMYFLQIPIYIIATIAFLGSINPRSLLRSEKANAAPIRRLLFHLVLFAALGGSFLATLTFVGKENVSQFSLYRDPKILVDDCRNARAVTAMAASRPFGLKNTHELKACLKAQTEFEKADRLLNPPFHPSDPREYFQQTMMARIRRVVNLTAETVLTKEAKATKEWRYIHEKSTVRAKLTPLLEKMNDKAFGSCSPHFFAELSQHAFRTKNGEQNKQLSPADLDEFLKKLPKDKYLDFGGVRDRFRRFFQGESSLDLSDKPRLASRFQAAFGEIEQRCFIRMLLEMVYTDAIKAQGMVSTSVVIWTDQLARLWILVASTTLFFLLLFSIDLNQDSPLRRFYESRLKRVFLARLNYSDLLEDVEETGLLLKDLQPQSHGWPYPLFIAAVRSLSYRRRVAYGEKSSVLGDSDWYSFLLSPKFCGWLPRPVVASPDGNNCGTKLATYALTRDYSNGEITVARAIALSGAAVTPWMASNDMLRFLMHLFNLRLERWMNNPRYDLGKLDRMPLTQALKDWWSAPSLTPEEWRRAPVADGGFREFLAVEELLERRCQLVIAFDAGCNNGLFEFGVISDLVRRMRVQHNIHLLDLDHELPLEIDRLRRLSEPAELKGRTAQHFVIGRIRYPEHDFEGLFVYAQMSLTGDEEIDLQQFQRLNPNFPDEPTTNQFYDEAQVESFRQLGNHVAHHLCQRFSAQAVEEYTPDVGAKPAELTKPQFRLELLKQSFIASYMMECLQETVIAVDDANPDWPFIDDGHQFMHDAMRMIHKHEVGGALAAAIAMFVSKTLEGPSHKDDQAWNRAIDDAIAKLNRAMFGDSKQPKPPVETHQQEAVERLLIAPVAMECNRRYVGYGLENPVRFFKVGGRRLLARQAAIAATYNFIQASKEPVQQSSNGDGNGSDAATSETISNRKPLPERDEALTSALGRFAVAVPRGVFRESGPESACDAVICALCWIAKRRGVAADRFLSFLSADFRASLRDKIRTGVAAEVGAFLRTAIQEKTKAASKKKPPSSAVS